MTNVVTADWEVGLSQHSGPRAMMHVRMPRGSMKVGANFPYTPPAIRSWWRHGCQRACDDYDRRAGYCSCAERQGWTVAAVIFCAGIAAFVWLAPVLEAMAR